MLRSLREFIEQYIGAVGAPRDPQQQARIAAAALWLEMVREDGVAQDGEHAAVLRAVRAKFGLADDDARALVALSDEAAGSATDYFEFTTLINRHCTAEHKEQIVEQLWQVAYADGELSAREEHLVRKIADLLYVSHGACLRARQRARDRAGG
jgi:uncharacterized tellurite resistance protein B-like protein